MTKLVETGQVQLSPVQFRAIALLAGGETLTATAKDVGVSRQTLSKWKNRDPAFSIALNTISAELLEASIDRRKRLDRIALSIVGNALETGDVKVAIQWLNLRTKWPEWDANDARKLATEYKPKPEAAVLTNTSLSIDK